MPFSTPMVQAIAANQKLQTRRTKGLDSINDNPNLFLYNGNKSAFGEKPFDPLYHWFERIDKKGNATDVFTNVKCPYGQIGDILWVRENHYAVGAWFKNGKTKSGRNKWKFSKYYFNLYAYMDNPPEEVCKNTVRETTAWFKRSSLYMPKEACRFFLKITDIRVERLQDISEIDAIKEGIYINTKTYPNVMMNYMTKRNIHGGFPSVSFATLWQSINGKESWSRNPWVWVISFERIEKPENFI